MNNFFSSVAGGLATHKANDMIDSIASPGEPTEVDLLKQAVAYLHEIARVSSPHINPDQKTTVTLYPNLSYGYRLPEYDRPHCCMYLTAAAPLAFRSPGIGTYQKSVGPGWVLLDLDGGTEIYATDTNQYTVQIVFCDDPRGNAI